MEIDSKKYIDFLIEVYKIAVKDNQCDCKPTADIEKQVECL